MEQKTALYIMKDIIKSENRSQYRFSDNSLEATIFAIEALERQSRIDDAIKILQTIDWVGSGAKARIQEAIELLTQ